MRAVLEDVKTGEVETYEVPAPELQSGGILVRTAFSAISAGTEKVKIESGQKSLLGKAMARPDLVKQLLDFARTNGVKAAWQKVQARLDTLSTMGYSCAGYVLEASPDVADFKPGDRVACAGAGYASHCELNFILKNLAVRVPDNVGLDAAALTTIGSIAMQGVRQANVTFGETVIVIGAGLVGVLTIQILRAAGCRVIAIDLSEKRAQRAVELGAHLGLSSTDIGVEPAVMAFSRYGADAAIITAATKSAEPLELAAKLLRDRGRIVVVGDVGMGVSRPNIYMKEISILMSRSYGPGRYDPRYEEGGQDYPIGFVRWTERRNMEAFLDLISTGAINVAPLISSRFPVEEAGKAYEALKTGAYTGIIDYHAPNLEEAAASASAPLAQEQRPRQADKVRVGCIGAGGFARGVIFPQLQACTSAAFESVATTTGASAESARKGFKFEAAQTPSELVANPNVDAVFVISRHDSHARFVSSAIDQGKAVFVEKPLAVNREQLDLVKDSYRVQQEMGKSPFLMVGFNRRFAPFTSQIQRFFGNRREPMMVQVRCNAGFIPLSSWIQNEHDGGRIIGEFCHFVDWARAVVARPITTVFAVALPDAGRYNRDNISVTLSFDDGSVATLLYLANGDRAVPKEYFEVFCQGGIAQLNDFKQLELHRSGKTERKKSRQDKGHRKEIELTIDAINRGKPSPIPFEELAEVTEVTFAVEESLKSGRPVSLKSIATYISNNQQSAVEQETT